MQTEKTQAVEIPVGDFVLDTTLYPRTEVDKTNVRQIKAAIEAGVQLPPVIADKKTRRVVDGFHRITAYRSLGHTHAMAELRTYKNDGELLLAAMRLNAPHGRKLSTRDHTHCLILARKLKVSMAACAAALHTPMERLEELCAGRIAKRKAFRDDAKANGSPEQFEEVALKGTIRHMAGRELDEDQVEANKKLGGMSPKFFIGQVQLLLDNQFIDLDDEGVIEALRRLHETLGEFLEST